MSRVCTLEQAQGPGVLGPTGNEDWVSPFLTMLGLTSGPPILYFQEAKGAHVMEVSVELDQQPPTVGRQVCASSDCRQSHISSHLGLALWLPGDSCITSWAVSEKAIVLSTEEERGRQAHPCPLGCLPEATLGPSSP